MFEPNNNISEQVIGQAFGGGGDEMIGVGVSVTNDNAQFESQFGNTTIGNFENFENVVPQHMQDVQLLRVQMEARFHAELEAKAQMQAQIEAQIEAELQAAQAAQANETARVAQQQHGNTFGVSAFPMQAPAMQQQQSGGFTNFSSQLW